MFEKEINLLPQELRKKEEEIRKKGGEEGVPVLIHRVEEPRVKQSKDKKPSRSPFPLPHTMNTLGISPGMNGRISRRAIPQSHGRQPMVWGLPAKSARPPGQIKRFLKRVWETLRISKNSLKIARINLFKKEKEEKRKSFLKEEEKKVAEVPRKEERELKEKKKEEEPPELKVTLLPEEFLRFEDTEKRLVRIIIVAGISSFLVGLSYFSLHLYGLKMEKKEEELNRETEEVNREIKSFLPIKEEYGKIEERIEALQKLLKGHPSWTSFLSFLEKYTLPQVSYRGLSADLSGSFALEARAPDIESAVWQVLAFRDAKDFVSEVKVSSITQEVKGEERGGGVNFTISLKVQPEVFYR